MLDKLPLFVLETAINRYIALDPHTQTRLQNLSDKIVNITFMTPGKPIELQLHISANGIRLTPMDKDLLADTYIQTTPLGCIKMMIGPADQIVSDEKISISGDIGLGQVIKKIFDEMQIDWEEPVSKVLGDSAAHQIGNLARGIKKNLQKSLQTSKQNIGEYITEELNLTPHRLNMDDFLTSVETLRDDVARLQARIQTLENAQDKSA